MAESNPLFLTNLCVVAADFRRLTAGIVCTEGVAGPFPYAPADTVSTRISYYTGSLAVTTGGSGLDLSVLAGSAYIAGDAAADQGMYWVENDAPVTLTVGAADPTNPRIDIVVATVRDSDYGGANDDWIIQVVAGTATVGATLSNLTGAPAVPVDSILLGYVLVPALFAGPFVNATHIRDARTPYGMCEGGLPRLTLSVDVVAGAFNFVKANYPWLKYVRARAWGAGGGGGGGNGGVVSGSAKGGGGGGGGYGEVIIDADRLAATEVCTPGTAGSAGSAAGGNGGNGGNSTFGAWITATGGGGGNGMTPATTGNSGVAGGSGSGGSVANSAGMTAEGGDGQGGYVHTGFGNRPNGGPAAAGGGGGRGGDGASAAQPGGEPGGGGGGGGSSTGNAGQTGAVGGGGLVVLELFG